MSKDLEDGLTEALGKTVAIVKTIEEHYRDLAFPIVLQTILQSSSGQRIPGSVSGQNVDEQKQSELRLPPNLSVNEFFRRIAPSSHPGCFVCAAYYLLHTGKAEKFTTADIMEIYGKLRRVKPKNPADIAYKCIIKAHITDAPESTGKQKFWVITPVGEKYVEGLLRDNTGGRNTVAG